MESVVTQSGINATICNPYGVLYQSLLYRRRRITWKNHKVIVVFHVIKSLVQLRFMPIVADYSRFEIVGSQYGRHTAQMFQTHPYGIQKVLCLLQRYAYHIGIAAVRHAGDKRPNIYDFSGIRVNIAEVVTGKVHHELLTKPIGIGKYSSNILLRNEILF